jgi:hypothetical protein
MVHIVPNLAITSLFGIHPLCNAGCIVVFDKDKCIVWYNRKIILMQPQNVSTDLWTLPIMEKTHPIQQDLHDPSVSWHPAVALFTHSICTRKNAVKFAHQLLENPRISTLLKATKRGFLHGRKPILKYLNPSLATAKGNMKDPCQGI